MEERLKKYIRSERANLFEPNDYIAMVIEISAYLPKAAVECAVKKAYQANETTLSKIVLDERGNAWYEKMEATGCRFFCEKKGWETLLKESERTPFALKEGELVRTYVTEGENRTILLVHAHHLAGDGKSMLILIKDIVNSLDGEEPIYKPMTLVDSSFLEKRARLMLPIKMAIKRLNQKWEKRGRSFSWEDYDRIHKIYWETCSSQIEVKTYEVNELKKYCADGVTLNSCMVTGLLKAHSECKIAGIPVSIREENGGMSNQTTGITIRHRYDTKKSFRQNQIKVHRKIHRKIKNKNKKYFVLLCMALLSPSLIDGVLMQTYDCYQNRHTKRLARIMGYTAHGGSDLGITNLNQIDIPGNHKKFQIENILFIPPKVSYSKNVIGIASYGKRLIICYHNMVPVKTFH